MNALAPDTLEDLCSFIVRFAHDEGYLAEDAEAICTALKKGDLRTLDEERAFIGWDALTCLNLKKPLTQELYNIFGEFESLWQVDGWLV